MGGLIHPLALIGMRTFLQLIRQHGVDPGYRSKAAALMMSCSLGVPFRWLDSLLSSRIVARTPIQHPPVFIVGHWRSGTTHLHNLLSLDPQFGCVRGIHCVAARSFLGARRVVQKLLGPRLPSERPMDSVQFGLDRPQEEEFAMSRIAPMSLFHAFGFPRRMRDIFDRWVTFESASPEDVRAWKETYSWLLRRVSLDEGNKPLCLKCPPHTARLRILRELFPEARFVHIYRNPYVVYHSNLKMWRKVIAAAALHRIEDIPLEANLFDFYRRLMERFFEDAASIPEDRLVQLRFEDLEADPIGELERIYETLGLSGIAHAAPRIREYLHNIRQYHKNTYDFDEASLERVGREWRFALDRWGYERPNEGEERK